ncbi:MAG: NINE protein [Saprospiraceae bacterium]|nr:NINE protein [Saprospiraceae bacterium]
MKSRIIAGLLALILGVFGIHRFYLRDIGGGIFYVFLFIITNSFWFPVTWILGIIEGIRLFNMSNQEFDSKYNKNFVDYREIPGRRAENYRNTRDQRVPQKRDTNFRIFPKKNPFRKSALEKYNNYDFKGAISDYTKALDISPDDPELHFQIARAYSLTENKELAFRHLDTAVQYGMKDTAKIGTDEDLAFLRIQPEYESFKSNNFRLTLKAIGPEKKDLLNEDLLLSQIKKLNELREKGVISQEEFTIERKKIMNLKN